MQQSANLSDHLVGGSKFLKRMGNIQNLKEMHRKYKKGEGIILPGSKYIGPGNALNLGKPLSKGDEYARQHDNAYDRYLKAGVKAKDLYMGFSSPDLKLIRQSDVRTPEGFATFYGMNTKRLVSKSGLTKRIREKNLIKYRQEEFSRRKRL